VNGSSRSERNGKDEKTSRDLGKSTKSLAFFVRVKLDKGKGPARELMRGSGGQLHFAAHGENSGKSRQRIAPTAWARQDGGRSERTVESGVNLLGLAILSFVIPSASEGSPYSTKKSGESQGSSLRRDDTILTPPRGDQSSPVSRRKPRSLPGGEGDSSRHPDAAADLLPSG